MFLDVSGDRQTNATQSNIVHHNPHCRTIRLTAGAAQFVPRQKLIGYLPEFLRQIRQFQLDNNIQYNLIHTNYWLSAWVGMELKKVQPLKHVHTYHSLGAVKYARELGIENITTFVERLSREELAIYYAAADICVVPSLYNPSGLVAIEAMASGTPVVASNVGGLKYVVEHEQTGLLFPPQNTTSLSQAIDRLISEPKWRWKLGIAARERTVDLFTWDGVANQLNEFYLELIKGQNLDRLNKSWQYSTQLVGA